MKRRCAILILCFGILFGLNGCGNSIETVNVKGDSDTTNKTIEIGIDSLKQIGDGLYYDTNSYIVYWWNGILGVGYSAKAHTVPSPYYAPNGLPYKYNPDTNTLEEISSGGLQ